MKKTEVEIRRELTERAEKHFGKARADELSPDLEQMSAELMMLASFPLQTTDEP